MTEARLIEVYQLVSQAQNRDALSKAESLVHDYPNFQLAQLVYGDLWASQFSPLSTLGDIPAPVPQSALPVLRDELNKERGLAIELKDLSLLHWTDQSDIMVVTFGEVAAGKRSGPVKRQYWTRQGNQWKIFYEGVI